MKNKRMLALLAFVGTLMVATLAAARTLDLDAEVKIDVAAQTLEGALLELSRQGGFQLMISADTVPDRSVARLSGTMSLRTALERLLRDTSLSYKWLGDHTVAVTSQNGALPAAMPGAYLPPAATESSLRLAQSESAQLAATDAAPRPSSEPAIDEVVVHGTLQQRYESTATSVGRLNEDVRNIPRAVQVIPEQVILDQGVKDLQEAVRNVAGITPADGFGGTLDDFFVRGFALGQIYRNGVRLLTPNKPPTQNIESIEVLKGPSVLYGQGEPGGLVNVNTKRPAFTPRTYLTAAYGRYDFREVTFDSTGPFGDSQSWAYRVNGSIEDSRSFRDLSQIEQRFVSPSLLWQIDTGTRMLLTYEYFRDKRPLDRGLVSLPDGDGGRFIPDLPLSRRLGEAFEQRDVTDHLLELQLSHDFTTDWAGSLHVLHRRESGEQFHARPGQLFLDDPNVPDGTLLRSVDGILGREERISNVYAQLTGAFMTGALRHKTVFGVEWREWSQHGDYYGGASEFVYADEDELIPACTLDDSCFNIFRPVYGRLSGQLESTDAFYRSKERSWGAFARDRIEITSRLAFDLGVRYDATRYHDFYAEPGFESDLTFSTDGQFSPQAGVLFQPREGLTLYTSYATGFLPSFQNDVETNRTFGPQHSRQYEVGMKSALAGGRANLTLAAFHLVKDNIVEYLDDGPHLVGEVRSQGIEASITARLAEGWNVIGGYSYVDAEILGETSDRGHRPGNVADHTLSLWGSYEWRGGALSGLGVGSGVFYSADRYADSSNTWSLGGYTVVDASVWYYIPVQFGRSERSQVKLQLNGKNLFNERYFASSGGDLRITPGAPRTVLATAAFEF